MSVTLKGFKLPESSSSSAPSPKSSSSYEPAQFSQWGFSLPEPTENTPKTLPFGTGPLAATPYIEDGKGGTVSNGIGDMPPEKSSSTAVEAPARQEVVKVEAEKTKALAKKGIAKAAAETVAASNPVEVHDEVVEQRKEAQDAGKVEDITKATTPDAPVSDLDKELAAINPEPFVKEQIKKNPKIGRWTAYHQNKMKLLGTNIPIPGFDMPGSRAHKALIEDVNAERHYNQMQIDKLRYAQENLNKEDGRVKSKKLGLASQAYEKTIKEYADGLYRKDGTNGAKTLAEKLTKIRNAALGSGVVSPSESEYIFRDPPPYIIAKAQNSSAYLKLKDDQQFLGNLQMAIDDIYSKGEVTNSDQAQLDSSINHLIGILGGDATNTADAERVRRQYLMLKPEKADIVRKVFTDYFKAQKDVADATGQSQWSVSLKNKWGEIAKQLDKLNTSGNPIDAVSAIGTLFALGLSSTSGLPLDPGNIKANLNKDMMDKFMEMVMMSADVDFSAVEQLIERANQKVVGSMNARNETIGSGWREQNTYKLKDRTGANVRGPGKSLIDTRPDFSSGNWASATPELPTPELSADQQRKINRVKRKTR